MSTKIRKATNQLVAKMQTAKSKNAVRALFGATSADLGKAASNTHSPTPWETGDFAEIWSTTEVDYPVARCASHISPTFGSPGPREEANAALIVRAVNNHAALVAALEELLPEPTVAKNLSTAQRARNRRINAARAILQRAKATK